MEERQPWITLGCFTYLMAEVCELETQILLAEDLDLIEKGESSTLNKDIAEVERMLKALIKSLEKKPSNPGPLESLAPPLKVMLQANLISYHF